MIAWLAAAYFVPATYFGLAWTISAPYELVGGAE